MKQTKIVNLFAGPGAGKSTLAAGLFYELKMKFLNVELVTEYAKDMTWAQRTYELGNQPYVFGKQYHRMFRLMGKVDIIITDSPLLLCCFYAANKSPKSFKTCVIDIVNTMENLNYFVVRQKPYNSLGRNQTENEAMDIDNAIIDLLDDHGGEYSKLMGTPEGLQCLVDNVISRTTDE